MKRIHLFLLMSLSLALLYGCGAKALRPEVGEKVRSGNLATMFFMENKIIIYTEKVYKVLWNEDRQQIATFEGFWDIDKDLSDKYSNALNGYDIKSKTIQDVLSNQDDYDAVVASLMKMSRSNDKDAYPPFKPKISVFCL